MDPARYTNVNERQIFYSIYSPLFALDPSFTIRPGLVKSWTISPDGARVTFVLQSGVRFQDGTTFDAGAVKYNIDRILDPATGSAFRTILAPIKAVRAVGPATVELDLSAPFTPLLAWFTEGPGFQSSPTAIRKWGDQYALHPVGTGPFGFVEWVKNDHIALKRYDGYWETGLPYLDGLIYKPTPDETVKIANLRAGALDVIDTVPASQQRAFRAEAQFRNIPLAGSLWPMIRLNNAMAPFNNKALRQAISYAVNRDQIVTAIYFGQARPAYGPISPVYRDYFDPSISQWGIATNLDKARAKLAEGGAAAGLRLHARDLHVARGGEARAAREGAGGAGRDHGQHPDVRSDDAAGPDHRQALPGGGRVMDAAPRHRRHHVQPLQHPGQRQLGLVQQPDGGRPV